MGMRLIFDPRLEIDGESFAAQWRERPDNLALGSFVVERPVPRTFGEPSIMLTFIGGLAAGVLQNALWDGIKWTYGRLCASKGKPVQDVEVQDVKQADGTEVTVLRVKE